MQVTASRRSNRFDVDDLREPGTGIDVFKIAIGTYGTGGILTGANIKVRK